MSTTRFQDNRDGAPVILITGAFYRHRSCHCVFAFARKAQTVFSSAAARSKAKATRRPSFVASGLKPLHSGVRASRRRRAQPCRTTVSRSAAWNVAVQHSGTEGKPALLPSRTSESYAGSSTPIGSARTELKHELRVIHPQGQAAIINSFRPCAARCGEFRALHRNHARGGRPYDIPLSKSAPLAPPRGASISPRLVRPSQRWLDRLTVTPVQKSGVLCGHTALNVVRIKPQRSPYAIGFLASTSVLRHRPDHQDQLRRNRDVIHTAHAASTRMSR